MNSPYHEQLDDISVSLRCYEPAGETVEMTGRDLLGHTLITGGSGAGKTTRAIYPMLEQLIQLGSAETDSRHALVVFDTKGDGEMHRLLAQACREAGRETDFCIITADENSDSLDILSMLPAKLQAIDALGGLLASSVPRDQVNKYWEMTFEAMLRQALRLYVLSSESVDYKGLTSFIIAYLLKAQMRDTDIRERLDSLEERRSELSKEQQAVIDQIYSAHRMWDTLDYRTKSILQSMATPLVDGLNSPIARRLFARGKPQRITDALEDGKIVLISIDAIRYPEVARLAGCLLKGQFYDAVLERTLPGKVNRPAGLFLDDWLLSATGGIGDRFSDVSALSIIRSRGGYVVAGCQSLASLDLVIGEKSRRAAFANFANLLFFRGRDAELDAFAAAYFGQISTKLIDHSIPQVQQPSPRNRPVRYEREVRLPAVPVGALARLPLGECYAIIGDRIYDQPLCLIPTYAPLR